MNLEHIILAAAWIIYCILHSVLAAGVVKRKMQRWMGTGPRYYRIAYTLLAFVGFAGILLYQLSITSPLLFMAGPAIKITGWILTVIGALMMMVNIVKYFLQLSGLKKGPAKLERGGMHQFVRHPLYCGTFVFIWALWIVYPYLSLLIANIIITAYTLIALRYEEQKLIVEFGDEYRVYQQDVPMILPRFMKKK